MKIENNGINPLSPKATDATQRSERKSSSSQVAPSTRGGDKAELSGSARLLAKARTALETTPDVRSEQVDALRNQVENGTYTVQVEAVARKMQGLFKQ
jgi:flagellar biosynthesis anti-sigma factor FlgM